MKIFNIINKTPSIIYLNNENWIFKNEIDKNWFGIHVFMYSTELYKKLIFKSFLTFDEEIIIKYYLYINYSIQFY